MTRWLRNQVRAYHLRKQWPGTFSIADLARDGMRDPLFETGVSLTRTFMRAQETMVRMLGGPEVLGGPVARSVCFEGPWSVQFEDAGGKALGYVRIPHLAKPAPINIGHDGSYSYRVESGLGKSPDDPREDAP